ncbi:MAG TPA: hypothetical protein PK629_00365 [Oscillospiraceae bacterium]|nr:hypothetical protein [Oscillospiraceae bacterium]HPF55729.1 hypothetical protein [Clostridiales bacterium]HPK36133.1 hypothetical protein [Oscillospiraceae bacterium]HPR76919.1 hypothetical protein [Oscillospiraceae bacterium]
MPQKTLGVICVKENDLLAVFQAACPDLLILKPDDTTQESLGSCDAIAVLGGAANTPLEIPARTRVLIERQIAAGKRLLAEFCGSIGEIYWPEASSTRFDRPVWLGPDLPGLAEGDILDDQCGMRVKPWLSLGTAKPLLQFVRKNVHGHIAVTEETFQNVTERGLWLESDNLLICSFRLSNFNRSRFSPRSRWHAVVRYITEWLLGQPAGAHIFDGLESTYELLPADPNADDFEAQLSDSAEKGLGWFKNAGILIHDGKDGVLEGLATEIDGDGNQRMLTGVRDDCSGETALPHFLNYLLHGKAEDLAISDNLLDFCFDCFQIKEGPLEGMMRWTEIGWGACYQDDVARAILPQLFKCLILQNDNHLSDCVSALRFLVKTTGTDGTRVSRTDNFKLTPQEIERLHSTSGNFPCAHHNAYYWAALLLAYKLTGIEEFKNVAVKGLETLMNVYPNTIREHSQTQELCRLILPLAYLYWVTGEKKHKDWLYQVAADLQPMRHKSGAYAEWDEGYKAHRFSQNDSECSLLTKNGDPVVDLLYSCNWLPIGFIQAYFITGDSYFKELWKGIAGFMVSAQIHSANPKIDGGWTRALDLDQMEVFALPNDLGWGPWAIESGWTVAEISAGLMMGLLEDKLKGFFKK